MISLARHIELLLLEHDCVIVPGLGGFIANHAEAQYCGKDEELFLPPYRTIGFNPQLQVNDGLLVQSYMAAYDASYPAAYLQMEKDIEKMVNTLDMDGECLLEHIGLLKKELNEAITLAAPENGVLTPSLYGLYSYGIRSLESAKKEKEVEASLKMAEALALTKEEEDKPEVKKKKDHIVIHLNRRWLDVGIAAAAAVLLFFCVSYPAIKTISSETDTVMAAVYPMVEAGKSQTADTSKPTARMVRAAEKKAAETPAASSAEPINAMPAEGTGVLSAEETEASSEQPATLAAPQAAEPRFAIVLASYVSQSNAEAFIASLAKTGLTEGRYTKTGKVSRVLYAGYATEAEAQKALAELRLQNKEFAEAWVLEL